MKTIIQHITDTGNKPKPIQAAIIPKTNEHAPAIGEPVASMIAGNVMTDRVTYGT